MVSIRLRYPGGVTTLEASVDQDDYTVQELQQEIYAATNILPSRQDLKVGYPPRPLIAIPELPVASLGLQKSEPIIVSEKQGNAKPSANLAVEQTVESSLVSKSDGNESKLQTHEGETSFLSSGPDYVETEGGVLVHRIVPDDNSCLFSAVALVFEQDVKKAQELRKIVAQGIRRNPGLFTEAILGMPPDRYINAILKPSTWGGAIELGILATHYGAEINSIDVETGRVDRFAPADGVVEMRCILIYSGIHYDAISLAPTTEASADWHQTLFPIYDNDPILSSAKKLTNILRDKKAFTNTATFDLKCEDCGQGLKGEKDARIHAAQTGHVRFGEYSQS